MKNILGDYLKNCRLQANLSQAEVANHLGYSSPQFISNMERGICAPPLKKIAQLSHLYKCNPHELLDILMQLQKEQISKYLFKKKPFKLAK